MPVTHTSYIAYQHTSPRACKFVYHTSLERRKVCATHIRHFHLTINTFGERARDADTRACTHNTSKERDASTHTYTHKLIHHEHGVTRIGMVRPGRIQPLWHSSDWSLVCLCICVCCCGKDRCRGCCSHDDARTRTRGFVEHQHTCTHTHNRRAIFRYACIKKALYTAFCFDSSER